MNQFYLIGISGPEHIEFNHLFQGLMDANQHPALQWVYECDTVDTSCPVNTSLAPSLPAIFFMLHIGGDTYKEVAVMTAPFSRSRIERELSRLSQMNFDSSGSHGGGIIDLNQQPGGPLLSLPIFNLGGNMPPFFWLLATAFTGYKTARAKKKIVWGGLTAVCAGNYLHSKSQDAGMGYVTPKQNAASQSACADGNYPTASGHGACSHHGGTRDMSFLERTRKKKYSRKPEYYYTKIQKAEEAKEKIEQQIQNELRGTDYKTVMNSRSMYKSSKGRIERYEYQIMNLENDIERYTKELQNM